MTQEAPRGPVRVLILGAGGRDFHNFNVVYRDNPDYHVVAFTATQIPNITDRTYPPSLAGPHYPSGIPIHPQEDMGELIERLAVDEVVLAYSDISHQQVMEVASIALAQGPSFRLLGPAATMLRSRRPVVAVCAGRTGAGKSQTTRAVVQALVAMGRKVAVVRHPMPYGDLAAQAVQRFASYEDLEAARATIEEREEYEPHLAAGSVVFVGVDYERILRQAEDESDVIVWDGGNNDIPFYWPDLHLVVVDPLRAGDEVSYYPGLVNVRMADVLLINKIDSATPDQLRTVRANCAAENPRAEILEAESRIMVSDPDAIRGRRVVVVEDGPTLTHGGMAFGAGRVAAVRHGAAEIVDPRPYAVRSIAETYAQYPNTGDVLPAMGYSEQQIADLEASLDRVPADLVIVATPVDLAKRIRITKPTVRVRYELGRMVGRSLAEVLAERLPAS